MQKINSSVSFMIAYLFLFVGMEVNDGSVEDMTPLPPPPFVFTSYMFSWLALKLFHSWV